MSNLNEVMKDTTTEFRNQPQCDIVKILIWADSIATSYCISNIGILLSYCKNWMGYLVIIYHRKCEHMRRAKRLKVHLIFKHVFEAIYCFFLVVEAPCITKRLLGCEDGSLGKGTQLNPMILFLPWNSHSEKREATLESCFLTSTHTINK